MPAPRLNSQPIDTPLLRAIHGAAREHKVSREELHEAILAGCKKTSLKDLTKGEAYRLLDGIRGNQAAPHSNWRRRDAQAAHGRRNHDASADAIYPATDRERQMLREAADLRQWDDATLTGFIARQLGKPVLVTLSDFNKVFWALKAMNRRDGLHQ
ncbi:MAG TPA: hypothetical protein VHY84_14885 [Bryobacteraceae bacterium]|jgi:hypothetical protein|nr:hypothetical protein [Bryobacteraceae bacterium]